MSHHRHSANVLVFNEFIKLNELALDKLVQFVENQTDEQALDKLVQFVES